MRLIEKALTITARAMLVTTIRVIIIERMLVALKYKESGKDRCYRLH